MIEDPEVKVSQPTFKACAQRATSPLSWGTWGARGLIPSVMWACATCPLTSLCGLVAAPRPNCTATREIWRRDRVLSIWAGTATIFVCFCANHFLRIISFCLGELSFMWMSRSGPLGSYGYMFDMLGRCLVLVCGRVYARRVWPETPPFQPSRREPSTPWCHRSRVRRDGVVTCPSWRCRHMHRRLTELERELTPSAPDL